MEMKNYMIKNLKTVKNHHYNRLNQSEKKRTSRNKDKVEEM